MNVIVEISKVICRTIIFCSGVFSVCLAQNPITPEGTFFSDPSARQWNDGRVYVYGSRDESKDYWCSYDNDVLSSVDLKRWTLHKNVFSSRGKRDEVVGTDALLFASDCIYKDSVYYLFYCTPDEKYNEGIATSSSPVGPFRNGYRLSGCNQIDPSVLIDDDGQVYYYWGQQSLKVAKLYSDFSGIDKATIKNRVLTAKKHYFHEGVQAFKRNGVYYLSFSDQSRRGKPTCLGYATSDSPTGPFVYRGVIIDNYGCDPYSWNNHGSIVQINNEWYVFYHRSTNGCKTFRKACVEPIQFDENGLIKEVEMTSQGAGEPLNPCEKVEARLACKLKGNVRITTLPGGQELLTGIRNGDMAEWKYFSFKDNVCEMQFWVNSRCGGSITVSLDKDGNHKLCTVNVSKNKKGKVKVELPYPVPVGQQALYFHFSGERDKDLFELESFMFRRKK